MNENPYSSPDAPESESAPEPKVYRDAEDELLDNSTAVRVLGAIAIALGCLLGHSGVYTPLQSALNGAKSLHLSSGVVGASIGGIICGVVMLVAGKHTRTVLMHRWYNATPLNVCGTLVVVAVAIVSDIYFESLLTGLGYVFQK